MCKYVTCILLSFMASSANATLTNGDNLSITSGTFSSGEIPVDGQGSWVSMEVTPNNHVYAAINGFNGINLGTAQPFPPDIDMPWTFFSVTGLHLTTLPTNVLSATGDTAKIDFSGWGVSWTGLPVIDMSSGAWGANDDGVANVFCDTGCNHGDSYILEYTATVPLEDPSGFGGVHYALHLEGYITAVPVPSAVWLFGSGLIGFIGWARRKKA